MKRDDMNGATPFETGWVFIWYTLLSSGQGN